MYSRKENLAKSMQWKRWSIYGIRGYVEVHAHGTVFGKQLELDQIVGCSTVFSYKAIETPKHSSYTTEKEKMWAICAFY